MTNVGCELLGSPVGPPRFCYSFVLSKINDILVYTSDFSKTRRDIGMANYEKQATYPIPISLPPMPHCLIYKDVKMEEYATTCVFHVS